MVITLGYALVRPPSVLPSCGTGCTTSTRSCPVPCPTRVITATLAGVYVGGVALLTGVLPFSGQARTAVSVLIAVALFAPLRRRVQRAMDRRFNRARYDSEAVLAAFAQRMREQADIDAVRADLAAAVTRSLDPGHVSLWVRAGP